MKDHLSKTFFTAFNFMVGILGKNNKRNGTFPHESVRITFITYYLKANQSTVAQLKYRIRVI